jgi:hypothetical protein
VEVDNPNRARLKGLGLIHWRALRCQQGETWSADQIPLGHKEYLLARSDLEAFLRRRITSGAGQHKEKPS